MVLAFGLSCRYNTPAVVTRQTQAPRERAWVEVNLANLGANAETVRDTLQQGIFGWQVTGCTVTLTDCSFAATTAAGDFRNLTPLVLMSALQACLAAIGFYIFGVPDVALWSVLVFILALLPMKQAPPALHIATIDKAVHVSANEDYVKKLIDQAAYDAGRAVLTRAGRLLADQVIRRLTD